jgi:hypothetical protein
LPDWLEPRFRQQSSEFATAQHHDSSTVDANANPSQSHHSNTGDAASGNVNRNPDSFAGSETNAD